MYTYIYIYKVSNRVLQYISIISPLLSVPFWGLAIAEAEAETAADIDGINTPCNKQDYLLYVAC